MLDNCKNLLFYFCSMDFTVDCGYLNAKLLSLFKWIIIPYRYMNLLQFYKLKENLRNPLKKITLNIDTFRFYLK